MVKHFATFWETERREEKEGTLEVAITDPSLSAGETSSSQKSVAVAVKKIPKCSSRFP